MSFHWHHYRDSRGRASRLAGGAVLMLAIGVAASALLGAWLGSRGRGERGQRPAREVADADAGGMFVTVHPAGDDVGRRSGTGGRSAVDDGNAGLAAGGGASGPDFARQRDGGDENLLAVWDHVERRIAAAMARARESVVALEYTAGDGPAGRRRVASGVVINHRGEILSVRIDPPRTRRGSAAAKASRDPAPIVARDYLGRSHAARWLAADPHTGLTLLLVAPRVLRPMQTTVDGPKLGSRVFVVGNPFGMGHSISPGHVAGLDRTLELGERQLGGLVLVQAPLYPGDSGASVVDVRGDWLGLIRGGLAVPGMSGQPSSTTEPRADSGPLAKTSGDPAHPNTAGGAAHDDDAADRTAEQDTDFGFAIPMCDALWIADQLRSHGRVDRAYLGVHFEIPPISAGPIPVPEPTASATPARGALSPASVSDLWRGPTGAPGSFETVADPSLASTPVMPAVAERDGSPLPGEGARLHDVVPDTPAARAGLRAGDRIIALDGQPIRCRNDLIDRLDRIPARKTIVLGIVREAGPGRAHLEVSVRTSSRPGRSASAARASSSAPSERRSARPSVSVTPNASAIPSSPPAVEPCPASPLPDHSATPPQQDPAPKPVPPAPERAESSGPSSVPSPAINDLGLTLPRAVERIEQLERRIQELEQFQAGGAAVATRGLSSKAQPDRAKAHGRLKP